MTEIDLVELDEYYILLDVPNYAIAREQRHLMERAIVEIGCGYEDGYEPLAAICEALRQQDNKRG